MEKLSDPVPEREVDSSGITFTWKEFILALGVIYMHIICPQLDEQRMGWLTISCSVWGIRSYRGAWA